MPNPNKMQSDDAVPAHMTKARLVEEIVALLHEGEGVTVEHNVRMPSISDPNHIREIDVLVTGDVAGHTIHVPIECKNYDKRISVAQIGEFTDKLEDVGLSVRGSIFVCVSGFGRDAKRRAKDHGIKIFTLEGLTPDRLSSALHKAFQSTVHLLLQITKLSFQSNRESDDLWSVMWITDRLGNIRGGVLDILWEKWQNGEISASLGIQTIEITPPDGWDWHIDDPLRPRHVTATLRVVGLVITAIGEAHMHVLNDILEQRYDRGHIRAIFRDDPDAIKLTVVENEEQLHVATRPEGVANIVFDSERAPRIHVLGKLYWPPTEKAANVVKERLNALTAEENPDFDSMQDLTFEEVEGTDISSIWGRTWSGHPSSRGEDWPTAFVVQRRPHRTTTPCFNPKKRPAHRRRQP